jgi:hypothetical protein
MDGAVVNDTTKNSAGESIVSIVCLVILVGGIWAWRNDNETKKKQSELSAAQAQIAATEKQQQAKRQAEEWRVESLNLCLQTADWNHDEYLKLNGHYNPKTNIITAPVWAFQIAETKRTNDISQCHLQDGGNQ